MDTTILIYHPFGGVATHARSAHVMPSPPDHKRSISAPIPQTHDLTQTKAGRFGCEHFR